MSDASNTPHAKRERYRLLVLEHRCIQCTNPLPPDHGRRECPRCLWKRSKARAELSEAGEPLSIAERRVQREIASGERCSCGLLHPCADHRTVTLDWQASRRIGSNTGA